MKKILPMLLMTALAVGTAKAGYLYWFVDGSQAEETFSYVTIKAGDSYLYDPTLGESYTKFYADPDTAIAGPLYSDGLSSEYMQELTFQIWNYGGDTPFTQLVVDYETWKDHAYDNMVMAGATPLGLTVPAPEPTSGLLVLLGAACLALRRKHGRDCPSCVRSVDAIVSVVSDPWTRLSQSRLNKDTTPSF